MPTTKADQSRHEKEGDETLLREGRREKGGAFITTKDRSSYNKICDIAVSHIQHSSIYY